MLLSHTFITLYFNKPTFTDTFDNDSLSSVNYPFVANGCSQQGPELEFVTETAKRCLESPPQKS